MSRTKTGDLVVTIVLLVVQALLIPITLGVRLILLFAADACAGEDGPQCNYALMDFGQWLGPIVAVIAFVVALIAVLRRSGTGARAGGTRFWIPLVGTAVTAIAAIAGFLIVDLAVPNRGITLF
ncbi:hypothetical protein HQQ81_07200 [Microbacteriaceae bacterium VKM Ac-2854]|nr:hypothetical protein [Microbacteriaceae bacterium VKM Ac-2854]